MANTRGKKVADDFLRDIDFPSGLDDMLGAAAAAPSQTSDSTATTGKNPKAPKKVKYPCGKCDLEVTGNSVCCNACEAWFHYGCVEGMSKEYFNNCLTLPEKIQEITRAIKWEVDEH